ncbi:MAG: UDP-N-acetylmuramate--L-alanine ligase [Elusimicrobiota bacterium]
MMGRVRRIHFVGIGGIGMSGIAQVLLNLGYQVAGSDLKPTELTRRLAAGGARIFTGHRAGNIRGAEVVVVSSAVARSNPEVRAARAGGIPVIPRAEMLAELARLKKTVTVSGTHGKTTTTAMTAVALAAAGADPTMIVGGQLANIGSNARLGMGELLVAEADESDGSFLRLRPLVTVVTNIDSDHLDHYGSFGALKKAFLTHIHSVPFDGVAVLCLDDPVVRALLAQVDRPVVTYGLRQGADWRGRILPDKRSRNWGMRVALYRKGRKAGTLTLKVPGRHNAQNALAAVAVCSWLGMDLKKTLRGLASYDGVGRRLDRLGEAAGVTFIDDYGHHPTELRTVLETVRSRMTRRQRLVAIFQPHRYSRTKALHRSFGPALALADKAYVMEIYAAGEKPLRGVTSRLILEAARRSGADAHAYTRVVDLVRELKPGDVVVTLGAGDVWKTGLDLLRRLDRRTLASI